MAKEIAVLAGGCFWGVEEILRQIPGVVETEVGYCGGEMVSPSYEDIKKGTTNHAEAVKIDFENSQLSFEQLLDYFFRLHDPTTLNRQGNDTGTQYRSSIFCQTEEQKQTAEKKKEIVQKSGLWPRPVVTQIAGKLPFYSAEKYHQDYLQKNPNGYNCHFLRD